MNRKMIYNIFLMCALILGGASGIASAGDQDTVEAPQVEIGLPGTVFRYEQTFGENGVAYLADSDHLYWPAGIGIDGAGNLWVTEDYGARAMKYEPDGTFLMSIGTAGLTYLADETHFSAPLDVAVDSGGNVWVVDSSSARVVKFDADGNYLTQLGVTWEGGSDNAHFDWPFGVAFDSSGRIYVSDYYNHRVQVFESNGFYSKTIGLTGNPGSDDDQFNAPTHIAIDDNDYLYVADNQNHRVQIFDASHALITTLGITGECGGWGDNTRLCEPRGVVVDESYIYVADSGNHRVQVFDKLTYGYVITLGLGGGSGDYQLDWPSDVAMDSDGYIYVADLLNQRVQKYEFDEIGLTFNLVHTFGVTDEPYLTDSYHYNQPFDVAVDDAGNIAIVEDWSRGHRLVVLDASGMHKFTIGAAGMAGDDNEHFSEPKGVAFDAGGNIYVADCGNHRVQIFNSTGVWVARIGIGWGTGNYEFKCPAGVAVGNNGYIFVADSDNHRIQIYDSNRVYVDTLGVTGVPGSDNNHFKWPQDVEVDADGNIYTAEWANHRVQKFNSDLEWQMTLGITGECGYDFDHFCEPYGVAVDIAGNIYVAEKFGYRAQVFDASGAYLTTIAGANSDQTGGLRETYGLDVDNAGNVYIADLLNHRVQKFTPGVPGWEQINVNGFGIKANDWVYSQEVFKGQLYAGVGNVEQDSRIWRTADGVTWAPASEVGFGTGTRVVTIDMIEFKGQLYAGAGWTGDPGQVWRTADGASWEAVTTDGFGDGSNDSITAFGIFNGSLYAGTCNANGTQIWRSSRGNAGSWLKAAPVVSEMPGRSCVTSFTVFKGELYAAIEGDIAQVWRSTDGSVWTAVVTDGFGDENNTSPGGFAVFDGFIYLGTNDGQLWRSDDGTAWEQVTGYGFADPYTGKVDMLFALDGWLYAGLGNPEVGIQIWRSDDGSEWEQVNPDGFGDSNNPFTLWSNATTVFECRLTIGTANWANGAEIWSMLEDAELCVDKIGPDSAYYGEAVTYQLAVTYSSLDTSSAQILSVVDDVYGAATYASGDANDDGYLDVSETWIYQVSGTIGAPGEVDQDPIVNTVTVSGQDMGEIELAPATDTHTTDVHMQMFLPLALRD